MSAFVTGLVLAAGGSSRLGQPKQLLPYGDATLLDHVLGVARACRFDQLVCVIGGAAEDIRSTVGFEGVEVVENPEFGEGCSSSIAAALGAVDPRCDVLVLMLGDQPGVTPTAVRTLLARRHGGTIAVSRYDDGIGHPVAFTREVFGDLASLHGDKGVWKLIERRAGEVIEVHQHGSIPPDVDTWEDYEGLAAAPP